MFLKIPILNSKQYKILDELLASTCYKHVAAIDADYIEVTEDVKKYLFLQSLKHGIVFEEVDSIQEKITQKTLYYLNDLFGIPNQQ